MKDYQKDRMFLVMFHNDRESPPGRLGDFVRDSFNDEVAARLARYQREMPGNILALIFTGDAVFFHTQPFDGSPPALQVLADRPFGLKPTAEADFTAFDRFLAQTESFIQGTGDSLIDLAVGWQHFSTFVLDNADAPRNAWAMAAGFDTPAAAQAGEA